MSGIFYSGSGCKLTAEQERELAATRAYARLTQQLSASHPASDILGALLTIYIHVANDRQAHEVGIKALLTAIEALRNPAIIMPAAAGRA